MSDDVEVRLTGACELAVKLSRVPHVGEGISVDVYGCRGSFIVTEVVHIVNDNEAPEPVAECLVEAM